ncbi:hypothetical protein BKA61DRAFT_663669 [Leptodontidium sp. MPI-SDFR-AT-0119]|nr:hypothetical protein BKA61DRAFT_663669 [Leptodontidium sp. MPI-SDFR-AT-0119]
MITEPEVKKKIQALIGCIHSGAEARGIRKFDDFPGEEDVSVLEWVGKQGIRDPFIDALASHLTTAVVGREPGEVGIHYFLDYIKSGVSYESITSEGELGAQSLKVKQDLTETTSPLGTSAIATGLATSMKPGTIFLNTPVEGISQYGDQTLVTTSTDNRIKTHKVILVIPTNTYD